MNSKNINPKTTTLELRNSLNRSLRRHGFLIILLVFNLACLALAPVAQATCQDGCLSNYSTALGEAALLANTGYYNTAIGFDALYRNTTGGSNTASGYVALFSNTTGNNNTATGLDALYSNTIGNYNTASGSQALYSDTIGSQNAAHGFEALFSNTTGSKNLARGYAALVNNTTGNSNTAVGEAALLNNTRGGSKQSCDACQTIQGQINAANREILDLRQHAIGPYGKPGEPPKPPKPDPEIQAKILALQKTIDGFTKQLNQCHKPAPDPPPLAVKAFTVAGVGTPDPQVAVGHKYVAALSTSNLVFLDKSTQAPITSNLAFPNDNGVIRVTDLFQSLFKHLDESMNLPSKVCDPNDPAFNSHFDPKHPDKLIPGCISEAYDTRVLYDETRHRFWIESAVRHRLWLCPDGGPPFTGVSVGDATLDPGSTPNSQKCHHDWDTNWVHRFVVVAVTQVDDHGREDLSKAPYIYGLFDDMGDWPLMSLHGNYLAITHKDRKQSTPDPVAIFDADRLANPHPGDDKSALKIKPLVIFDTNDLTLNESGTKLAPEQVIYPVNLHGTPGQNHFLVSYSGDSLLILGFRSPRGDPSGKPEKLVGTSIALGSNHNNPRHNPEYRDGMIHLAWQECDQVTPCKKTVIRVLRIPVNVEGDRIVASDDPTKGFLDCRFADEDDAVSLTLPMLAVNKNNDMVVAFERVGSSERISAGVRFRIWYHDHGRIGDGAWMKRGETTPQGQDIIVPPSGVDLGGIAVDPEDHLTVWMSHAFANSSGAMEEVVAAVKP